jgi:hypothetical protein
MTVTLTTLVSFNFANCDTAEAAVIADADADGDVFGKGGVSERGTLLEIVKTTTGFASTADQL